MHGSKQSSWWLSKNSQGIFLVELSVFGEDYDEKSRHVIMVDVGSNAALVHDIIENYPMNFSEEVLRACSGAHGSQEIHMVRDITEVVKHELLTKNRRI